MKLTTQSVTYLTLIRFSAILGNSNIRIGKDLLIVSIRGKPKYSRSKSKPCIINIEISFPSLKISSCLSFKRKSKSLVMILMSISKPVKKINRSMKSSKMSPGCSIGPMGSKKSKIRKDL